LETGRASAAFNFHLAIHLEKEDEHLYCPVKKLVPTPELIKALTTMSGTIPQENFPESRFQVQFVCNQL